MNLRFMPYSGTAFQTFTANLQPIFFSSEYGASLTEAIILEPAPFVGLFPENIPLIEETHSERSGHSFTVSGC